MAWGRLEPAVPQGLLEEESPAPKQAGALRPGTLSEVTMMTMGKEGATGGQGSFQDRRLQARPPRNLHHLVAELRARGRRQMVTAQGSL